MTNQKLERILNRIMWRSRLRRLLQLGGIVLIAVGFFFAVPRVYHPGKSTIFHRIVNTGTFSTPAVIMIGVGAIALAASWLIRGDLYEEP